MSRTPDRVRSAPGLQALSLPGTHRRMGFAARNPSPLRTMMGSASRNVKMGSSFRWNDGDVGNRQRSAQTLRAWIPVFTGMTVAVVPAFAGLTVRFGTVPMECPSVTGLGPGVRRDDGDRDGDVDGDQNGFQLSLD